MVTQDVHDDTSAVFYLKAFTMASYLSFFTGVVAGLIDDTVEEEREEESEGEQGVGDEESGDEIKKKRKRSKYLLASEPSWPVSNSTWKIQKGLSSKTNPNLGEAIPMYSQAHLHVYNTPVQKLVVS